MVHIKNSIVRTIHEQGIEIKLDLSIQILSLDIPQDVDYRDQKGKAEAELYPAIQDIPWKSKDFVSVSIFVANARQFDDGLYTAVEYLCQDGTENFVGKKDILKQVAAGLTNLGKEFDENSLAYCGAFIHAAAALGGQQPRASKEVQNESAKIKSDFLANPLRSKPIGFYT